MSNPEQNLHNEFCLFGSHYLETCRTQGAEVDPKIYETIYKYLNDRDLEVIPTPDAGSVAEKEIEKLRAQKGE